jgi:hypothetical protein
LSKAQLTAVAQHQAYAKAIIGLRYETGTLIIRKPDKFRVDCKRLASLPAPKGTS